MKSGDSPQTIRTQKLVLIEHLSKYSPQPVLTHQRYQSSLIDPKAAFAEVMQAVEKFRHLAQPQIKQPLDSAEFLAHPRFDYGRSTKREQANHRADF
jgi:hypothetical protein